MLPTPPTQSLPRGRGPCQPGSAEDRLLSWRLIGQSFNPECKGACHPECKGVMLRWQLQKDLSGLCPSRFLFSASFLHGHLTTCHHVP